MTLKYGEDQAKADRDEHIRQKWADPEVQKAIATLHKADLRTHEIHGLLLNYRNGILKIEN